MNGKERFAGAVLLITLAIGIVTGVSERHREGNGVFRRACDVPVASVDEGYGDFRKIDLNVATVEELEILPGIGPKKAEAIVDYRERNGDFRHLDRLTEVRGIGRKTLERIAPYCSVNTGVDPDCD